MVREKTLMEQVNVKDFLVTQEIINAFAQVSGDNNPIHLDEEFANSTPFKGIIAHGMLTGSFISATIAASYPGAIYRTQTMSFIKPVRPLDTVTVKLLEIDEEGFNLTLFTEASVGKDVVAAGEANIIYKNKDA